MIRPSAKLITILLAAGLALASVRPANAQTSAPTASDWAIVSNAPLDPRTEAQLTGLAGASQTTADIFKTNAQALTSRPSFTLEMITAPNARAFEHAWPTGTDRPTPETIREAYRLIVDYRAGEGPFAPRRARITAIGPGGFHNALLRLKEVLAGLQARKLADLTPTPQQERISRKGHGGTVEITDFPSFAVRGIVEGFYGTPWSHQDRLDLLRFEGQHSMNSYFYAPKDDPYHRKQWRDPYPPDRLAQLGELVSTARANFVDFCFAVSPGLSMTYSSDEDFDKLTAKLESVGKLGTSCYALFLDDVPEEIQNDADKARYKTLAQAHAYVINKLYHHLVALSPQNHLVVTPTTYTNGFGSRDYIRELGAAVDAHVDLVWTGTEVVSPVITVEQTEDWAKLLKRPPLIWDNYPVDDYARWRPFLGPLVGRAPDLAAVVRGLVSNPMNEAHASMIPLATIADYLWNSRSYDPQQSEQRALVAQFGADGPPIFAPLLQAWGDYRWDNSNLFQQLWTATRLRVELPQVEQRLNAVDSALGAMSGKPQFDKVGPELSAFAKRTRDRAQALAGDPAMHRLADGSVQWNEEYNVLTAGRLAAAPGLDGDFAKWQAGTMYNLQPLVLPAPGADAPAQNSTSSSFSGKFALGWDSQYLYVGIDVHNPEIYKPPVTGNGGTPADDVSLAIETAYRRNYYATSTGEDAFLLVANPGNFQDVAPSFRIVKRNLPARFASYEQEVKVVWKRTAQGYSADVAIPAAYFDGLLQEGYEIGLLAAAQKLTPPTGESSQEDVPRLRLTSKQDLVIAPNPNNPATYQRVVLLGRP